MAAILLTGCAGFIGAALATRLLERGEQIIGIDNVNDYYDPGLKESRIERLANIAPDKFTLHRIDIQDLAAINEIALRQGPFAKIIHLAAQAGVRYSLLHPMTVGATNLLGQISILEVARNQAEKTGAPVHVIYASSSSVYGALQKSAFSVKDPVDQPTSLYGATKRANELFALSYARLFNLRLTGLRFFTVYGPWGRPDMAAIIFARNILAGKPITLFNHGEHKRSFTYIDDIVEGTLAAIDRMPHETTSHEIFNLGSETPEELRSLVRLIEQATGRKAQIQFAELQQGDIIATAADMDATRTVLGFQPKVSLANGIPALVSWVKNWWSLG